MFRETLTAFGDGRMRVELDKTALFALASDTRLDILRALQPMRRTVTQLADSLEIDKAAVHRHLKMLEEGGFVKRFEDHGFVYYGLSWKARDLISPGENTKVVILLSSSLIAFGVAMMIIVAALYATDSDGAQTLLPSDQGDDYQEFGVKAASSAALLLFVASGLVIVLGLALVATAARKTRAPKQRGTDSIGRTSLAGDEGH